MSNKVLSFEQLMAQATQVAKKQDAHLLERAKQKIREAEEKRKIEERMTRERKEMELKNSRRREAMEQKQRSMMDQKKQERQDKKRVVKQKFTAKSQIVTFEKKKPVHMSFDDLMKKAKEQSLTKDALKDTHKHTDKDIRKHTVKDIHKHTHKDIHKDKNSSIYTQHKRPIKKTEIINSNSINSSSSMSARDRAKLLVSEPPKRVLGQKKDKRTIAEVQQEIRHSKGIYSDDEDIKRDPRLIRQRKRPVSPVRSKTAVKNTMRRMPFSGRPMDRKKKIREEEDDDELASFIVDDDDMYQKGISDEISKIFRYDKTKYMNDPVFSDDDMEANASEVLREEKRSERLARREDLLEEQREMERLKRRKRL